MSKNYIFSSESVGEGHPDKVCDTISDAVLDACLAQDKFSRVACECYAKSNIVIVGGEITTRAKLDFTKIARDAIREIGYVNDDDVFHADKVLREHHHHAAIARHRAGRGRPQGQGQENCQAGRRRPGLMFGYACNETPELMPAPIMFAHRLGRELTRIRKTGKVPWLRPDAKSQVSVVYENDKPVAISNVVISTQHAADVEHREIEKFCIENIVKKVLPKRLLTKKTEFLINPTGRFVVGGPQGDTGLTGRKIIVDSYGGMGRHGGGAFSGKDPTKVDRSAAYMGRWVAKNIVAAKLAAKCEIQFAYAIGYPDPVSVSVDTFGTATVPESKIIRAVNRVFSFLPSDIIDQLNLRRPIYLKTTNYGHFGKSDPALTWEKTDKVKALQNALK